MQLGGFNVLIALVISEYRMVNTWVQNYVRALTKPPYNRSEWVSIILVSLMVKGRALLATGWVRTGMWETVGLLVLQDHLRWGQGDSSSGKWASSLLPEDVHLKHKCFHDVLPRYVYHELQEVPLRPDGSSGSMIAPIFFFSFCLGCHIVLFMGSLFEFVSAGTWVEVTNDFMEL